MGELEATGHEDAQAQRAFVQALLRDVRALERMVEEGRIESGIARIGAEQEMFLVDRSCHAAGKALEVLKRLDDPAFTTEVALFNLEVNLPPTDFAGDCLRRLEERLDTAVATAREAARECDADVLLTGILPSLQTSDVTLESMTPMPRYRALNDAMVKLRGREFHVRIKGVDELFLASDNIMLEAANTSFQLHLQVGPEEFPRLYNLAQAVSAPLLAVAANSPVLLEHRLWKETRVALFQHSVDDRSHVQMVRGRRPRVSFGDGWLEGSVLDIFREDVARFRPLLTTDPGEDPFAVLDRGELPPLRALCLHSGTVWRWNRACYGLHAGRAHLRIENRVLPAGPTVLDETANAAFYFGLMKALAEEYGDVRNVLAFDEAKANLISAARRGLQAQLAWGGRHTTAADLVRSRLLPLAREGLRARAVDEVDVERYLGVIEARIDSGRTGAQWALDSLAAMGTRGPRHGRYRALTAAALAGQKGGRPVHEWPLARHDDTVEWRHSYRTVGRFMTRDLFTVRPDDLVDLAANLMHWRHIRHVPVEDDEGRLLGIVSHRDLVRILARGCATGRPRPVAVRDIMHPDPITVNPDTDTLEAIATMRGNRIGCLPVVSDGRLVGIVTERDFIDIAARLVEEQLRQFDGWSPG